MSITSSESQFDSDLITPNGKTFYPDSYKMEVFKTWYRYGKPPGKKLRDMIPPEELSGSIPTSHLLNIWISGFKEEAEILDEQVKQELEARLVQEKIEMLNRHADLGVKMQDMAYSYLVEHEDELKAPTAIKLLIEGVRIERESKGIPQALDKMLNLPEDKLLSEITALLNKAPVEFEEIDYGTDEES